VGKTASRATRSYNTALSKQERLTHRFLSHDLQGAAAYEKFLFGYIDTKISVDNFACAPSKFPASKPVADIVAAIRPKKSK
jgi:hypothetical protein